MCMKPLQSWIWIVDLIDYLIQKIVWSVRQSSVTPVPFWEPYKWAYWMRVSIRMRAATYQDFGTGSEHCISLHNFSELLTVNAVQTNLCAHVTAKVWLNWGVYFDLSSITTGQEFCLTGIWVHDKFETWYRMGSWIWEKISDSDLDFLLCSLPCQLNFQPQGTLRSSLYIKNN